MKYLFFVACLFLTVSFETYAQKYAYIDSDFILSKLPEYKTAKDRLDKLADQWTKDIDEKYTVLNQKKDLFNKEEVLLPTEEKEKRQEELKKLENNTHIAAAPFRHWPFCQTMNSLISDINTAGCGAVDTGNHVDEGRFATAGFAHDTDKFTFVYFEIDAHQCWKISSRGVVCFDHIMNVDEMRWGVAVLADSALFLIFLFTKSL